MEPREIVIFAASPRNNETMQSAKKSSKPSSVYRGITLHGKKYQVISYINKAQYYIGSFYNETVAAIISDFQQVQMKGFGAKTNFSYTNSMV